MNWAEHFRVLHRLTGAVNWTLLTPESLRIRIIFYDDVSQPWYIYKIGPNGINKLLDNPEPSDTELNAIIPEGTRML